MIGFFFISIISFRANAITSFSDMYVLRTYVRTYIKHNNIMSHSIIRSAGTVIWKNKRIRIDSISFFYTN